MPRPALLLTRPEAAAARFAGGLDGLGLRIVLSPLQRIVPVPHDPGAFAAAAGLVFTSAEAVPFAGPGRGRPALCVGPATAAAAAAAGFVPRTAPDGTAATLAPLVAAAGPGFVHARGRDVAAELPVPAVVVYAQEPAALTPEAAGLLAEAGTAVLVPLFSPAGAGRAAAACRGARARLVPLAISAAAAARWDLPGPPPAVAARPDGAAMRALIAQAAAAEQSRGRAG